MIGRDDDPMITKGSSKKQPTKEGGNSNDAVSKLCLEECLGFGVMSFDPTRVSFIATCVGGGLLHESHCSLVRRIGSSSTLPI